MAITKEKKKELINQYQNHKKDTGSSQVQIPILSEKINNLTNHLTTNPKDYQSQRGLLMLVSKRRRHLNYLQKIDIESYRRIVDHLTIRN
ncbi:MAG: 30S ribosomal protein S15 [Candidatus Melainabacteria bacterium]|nr:30S ribosomal protein S15 [Candidatus Melainabacteria bacterium]